MTMLEEMLGRLERPVTEYRFNYTQNPNFEFTILAQRGFPFMENTILGFAPSRDKAEVAVAQLRSHQIAMEILLS